ncbi:T9SS type A sorting domain-containing protein [Paraflavitalea pollutisoli]|uniref:T9SS type A sorting domain-containing protein n=1 Tax=Paraflavitalea pollutisoli TaxID=3034143 RepID=UPI0023EAF651|nr:T9SS type A sorting domain-containing protein [Paraflavitalea sp. H1-2-19X]
MPIKIILLQACKLRRTRRAAAGRITCLFLLLSGIAANTRAQITITPKSAYSYTDGVGVNTHLRYTHLNYYTAFESIIYPKLKQLGIKHIRDNFPHPSFLGSVSASLMRQRYLKLHDSCGIKYDYLLDSRRVIDTLRFLNDAAYLELFDTNPELVRTIQHFEGFNEPDRTIAVWFPADWITLTRTIQQTLWTRTHSTPALSAVSIINASPTHFGPAPSMPDSLATPTPHISSWFDYANLHPYDVTGPANRIFPGARYDQDQPYYDTLAKGKPWITTEFGFPTARGFNNPAACTFGLNSFHYSSELAAGKYYSVAFMELFKRGAARAYAYEFIDQHTADQGDVEKNFGLLRTDGSEKPAYTAIKNTLAILKDTSLVFSPTPLALTITGDTAGVRYSLYQKNNGRYYLALWLGAEKGANYDYTTFTDVGISPQSITVGLPYTALVANLYQPLLTGAPINSYASTSSITIDVPDNLLLLEIAAPGESAGARTLQTPAAVGSPLKEQAVFPNPFRDVLTVRLSTKQMVTVYNGAGVVVFRQTMQPGTQQLNLGTQPAGIYYLQYGNGKKVKLVKW